jgi:hypothetical protein
MMIISMDWVERGNTNKKGKAMKNPPTGGDITHSHMSKGPTSSKAFFSSSTRFPA